MFVILSLVSSKNKGEKKSQIQAYLFSQSSLTQAKYDLGLITFALTRPKTELGFLKSIEGLTVFQRTTCVVIKGHMNNIFLKI